MRFIRPASVALATAVLAASAFTGPAAAQAAGVGSSLTSTKVLTAQLGEGGQLLDLVLVGDEARSTIDPAVASPEAYSRLLLLKAATQIVPNSPVNVSRSFEAKSAGPSEVPIAAGPLAASSSLPAELAPVLSGSVSPGKLSATVTDGVANAGLDVALTDIDAIGGLVGLDTLKSTMAANSAGAASDAGRKVVVENLEVLDLGALLGGLNLSLGELTPNMVVALVDKLGATTGLPLPSGTSTLAGAVTQLNKAIDDLEATVATTPSSTSQVTGAIDSTTSALLGSVNLTLPVDSGTAVGTTVALVNDAIAGLQDLVNALLAEGLAVLEDLTLLSLEGVEVGVSTKAVESLDGSSADVVGRIGKVKVGNLSLPGLDLVAAADSVSANVATINNAIGDVLAIVDPGLENLVNISVLEKATSVTQSDGYTRSRAGITAASATITPPANLAAIVKTVTDQVGVAQTLAGTTVGVPVLSSAMNDLGLVLKASTSVLTSPSRIQVASVLSASDFARAGAVTTTGAPVDAPMLPRTGGSDLVLFAGLAGVLALALRRLARTPEVRMVGVDEQ